MWTWFHKLASPPHFYGISAKMMPWFAVPAILLIIYGTYAGLFLAPPDYQQGDAFRIIYVHVPSAYLSMMAYMIMAISAAIGLIWRIKLSHAVAAAAAPLGAWFTFLALITGSIWGRPMWGTWWEWGDPRLMFELGLLFLYLGYIALRSAMDDIGKADTASAVLAIVGLVNIPIIKYSVEWWTTLHQGETFQVTSMSMPWEMALPLLVNVLGIYCLFGYLVVMNMRSEILKRESDTQWVQDAKREALGGI